MLKVIQQIDTNGAALELNRYHHIIRAYDGVQDLIEIDTKHQFIVRNKLKYPPTSVKCFNCEGKMQYFILNLNKIERQSGIIVSESNSKAEFTGCIDSVANNLTFSKYHHNYKKYSINYLCDGTKKILKLLDTPIKKLAFNPFSNQVIFNYKDFVSLLDLNEVQKQTSLFKKSTFLSDNNNLYSLSLNLQNKSKQQYQIGIFDFRTGKNSDSFPSKEPPIKIQMFYKTMLVANHNAIEFYDIRKLIKPFEREVVRGVKDFLYEPNIGKLFIGCDSKLKVYRTQY